MMVLAPWYESGSFWQFLITTLVGVAVGVLGALATMRASYPKRRLTYKTRTNAPLFDASDNQAAGLAVTHDGTRVIRPRIVELELRNTGRRDITETQFHAREALKFDLGADVKAVLGVASLPTGTVTPGVGIDPSSPQAILVPPTLMVSKQTIRATVLVDGPNAEVSCSRAPLIEVAVREAGPDLVPRVIAVTVPNVLLALLIISIAYVVSACLLAWWT